MNVPSQSLFQRLNDTDIVYIDHIKTKTRLTCIGTRHNDNPPRQVRDIVDVELGFGREAFVDE